MRVVIQRVLKAKVVVNEQIISEIGKGLLVFVGIEHDDNDEDIHYLCKKISSLRIFSDENGKMNLSVTDIQGEILVVSQFTLHASTKKGNRPSFVKAASADVSKFLYHKFVQTLQSQVQREVKEGIFAADMKVHLVNDGPVTILMDSKNKE